MNKLKVYYIDNDYIDYLRKFDKKVPFNKSKTRPYVGVVYTFNNQTYFAPLSSPKPKHLTMNKDAIDIFKIDDGELGIVNINNMIPTPISCLTEVLPLINEKKYKYLIINQTEYLNKYKSELMSKVKKFILQYNKNLLPKRIKDRCCDFNLLEEKCKEYEKEEVAI